MRPRSGGRQERSALSSRAIVAPAKTPAGSAESSENRHAWRYWDRPGTTDHSHSIQGDDGPRVRITRGARNAAKLRTMTRPFSRNDCREPTANNKRTPTHTNATGT